MFCVRVNNYVLDVLSDVVLFYGCFVMIKECIGYLCRYCSLIDVIYTNTDCDVLNVCVDMIPHISDVLYMSEFSGVKHVIRVLQ